MKIESFYDNIWSSEHRNEGDLLLAMRKSAVEYSYEALENLRGKSVLEIGCGSGLQSVLFAEKGADVTAIDLSAASLKLAAETAKKSGHRITTKKMNAERMSFSDGKFDRVYINSVLMHTDKKKILSEAKRVLKKNGILVVLEPLKYSITTIHYRLISRYRRTNPKYVSLSELPGFEHKEFYFFYALGIPLFMVLNSGIAEKLLKPVELLDRTILKIPLIRNFGWITVGKYEKRNP